MSLVNRTFGKARSAENGTSVQVGKWVASGFIAKNGEYHGTVRRSDAHFRQTVDMLTADAILADVDGFIAACEMAVSEGLERANLDAHKAKTEPEPVKPEPVKPSVRTFGKPGA